MQTTPMNFKNGVTIAVLLLIIFFSVGKISKQVQTFVGSGNNLAQVQTYLLKPTGVTAVTGSTCGGIVNLSWNATTGATYYQVTRNPGAVVLRSEKTSYSDTGLTPGASYQYQVRALSDTLSSDLAPNTPLSATSSAACSTSKLPTVTLTSSSASVTKGGSSTLTWSSTEASSCVAKDAWSGSKASSGTQSVSPSSTSTYTLDCTGSGGTSSASTTINVVVPNAPTLTFTASATSINVGQSSTLSWSATDATSCTASNGWSGTNGASGSQTVTPSTTKTYTLDCTGSGGSVSKSVTVTVNTPTTTAPKFIAGDYAKTTAGVNVRSTAGGSIAGKQVNGSLGTIISGPGQSTKSADPYWNVDFATGTDGWVLESYLTKTTTAPTPVPPTTPAPTLTISASPATLTSGSSSTLTWSSTNATSCAASGAWSGTKAVNSSEAVTPTSTSTYTLSCVGSGGSVAKSVTVTVSTPASSTTYKAGDSVATTTSVNVRDAANGLLLGTKNTGDIGVVLGGGTYVGGYHWWNVDYLNSPDGWTAESFLTTYTPPATPPSGNPPTVTISASPTAITAGQSATLTWSTTNATSCTASGAWSGAQATSGTKSVSPTFNATYTLACTGTGGTTTQSTKVTMSSVITPPPAPSNGVSLTPAKLLPAYGPLVASSSSTIPELKKLESNFLKYEQKHYTDYIGITGIPSVAYNHYGFLGSRLAYSIKNGLPYGSGVTDPTKDMYARGREVALDWLNDYALPNNFAVSQWQDTSLEDMEALVILENDSLAKKHITMRAPTGTSSGAYFTLNAASSDARGVTLYLQPMLIAHRLGLPFVHPGSGYQGAFDPTLGSWVNAAKRNIYWLDQYNVIKSDGSIPSPSHKGAEAYFMSSMLVNQILGYYAYIERDPVMFAMAKRVVDHWINVLPAGWNTLSYPSTSTSQAPDLASFFVYPSLVMWQETGQQKYYDFAVKNLISAGTAYISGHKQFNQIYNTDVFAADALIQGVHWKPTNPTFPPANKTTVAFYPDGRYIVGGIATITNGSSLQITWSSINATSCTASGGWSGAQQTSGKITVAPTTGTTYTLTCSGPYGTATQSVKVAVK